MVIEHYLLKMGFIEIASDGRKVTKSGLEYLKAQGMLEGDDGE